MQRAGQRAGRRQNAPVLRMFGSRCDHMMRIALSLNCARSEEQRSLSAPRTRSMHQLLARTEPLRASSGLAPFRLGGPRLHLGPNNLHRLAAIPASRIARHTLQSAKNSLHTRAAGEGIPSRGILLTVAQPVATRPPASLHWLPIQIDRLGPLGTPVGASAAQRVLPRLDKEGRRTLV